MKSTEFLRILISAGLCFWLIVAGESASATVDFVSVSVENTSGSAQSDVPISFGQVFARGAIVNPETLGARLNDGTALPLQVDAKATHGDGSLRHAVLTTILPNLAGGSPTDVMLHAPGSNTTGARVSVADLLATNFDADVSLNVGGTIYSASARDFLQNGLTTNWLSGPLVSEWLVSGPLATAGGADHDHLFARFHVRAYAGLNSVRVSVTVENNWSRVAGPGNFNYDAEVSLQGSGVVLSQNDVTHYRQARWRRVFWWGSEPEIDIAHDSTYLQRMGVVPTYDSTLTIPESVLDDMASQWTGDTTRLMNTGLIFDAMPSGGARPDIAPLPRWTARYLIAQDARAKVPMLGTSEQAGSFGVHYRDRDTDLPISLDTYPNVTVLGNGGIFPSCSGNCDIPYTADVSHQPSMSFVPYLVTGDFFHLEELQFWANWNLFYWGDHGGSQGLLVNMQIRAQAWGLRTLAHAAFITPDNHPLKAYFLGKLTNNLTWYEANYSNNPPTSLGYLLNAPDSGLDNTFATWMDDFFTWTVGHLVNLGFSNAQPIFDYKSGFPIGRMTNPDYCWILAATYWTRSRDQQTGNAYQTWADYRVSVIRSWDDTSVGPSFGFDPSAFPPNMSSAQEDSLIAAQCNSPEMSNILGLQRADMIGDSWNHEGYVSNLQPAVAMVAERGVTNGDLAWSQFESRAVVPDSGIYDYNISPQWAIVPGNVGLGGPGPGVSLPTVSISASPQIIGSGETAMVSWATSDADDCMASGAWSGTRTSSGSETVGPLLSDSTFILECRNSQGSRSASVTVNVAATDAAVLSLAASATSVSPNSNVTLTWQSQAVDTCSASGDWLGAKATSGSESVGPLTEDSSYTMTCSGSDGTIAQTVSVSVDQSSGGGTSNPSSAQGGTTGSGATGLWTLVGWFLAVIARTVWRYRSREKLARGCASILTCCRCRIRLETLKVLRLIQ